MLERDRRQYALIDQVLAQLASWPKPGARNQLVQTLSALLAEVQGAKAQWKQEFFSHWTVLEEVNAVMFAGRRETFDNDDRRLWSRSLKDMIAMLRLVYDPGGEELDT